MFIPPLESYQNTYGVIITNNVNRALSNPIIQNSGAVALATTSLFDLLQTKPLVIVGETTSHDRIPYFTMQID